MSTWTFWRARSSASYEPVGLEHVVARVRSSSDALSAREQDILALVARGTSNREIARALLVSEATVKTHLGHIYGKLGVNDRAAAVATAYERGLLGG